jgi:hypothetical protein
MGIEGRVNARDACAGWFVDKFDGSGNGLILRWVADHGTSPRRNRSSSSCAKRVVR